MVYGLAVGAARTLDEKVPPKSWPWIHSESTQLWILGIFIAASVIEGVLRIRGRRLRRKSDDVEREIHNQLANVIAVVSEDVSRPVKDFGCHLFVVLPAGLTRPEQLIRIVRVRLVDTTTETPAVYTKGKGVVGECWEREKPAYKDLSAIARRWAEPAERTLSDAEWKRLEVRKDTSMNFTKMEFESIVSKYSEVRAAPIFVDRKFVGCIALDLKWNNDDVLGRCLHDESVKVVLGGAAKTLEASLKRGRPLDRLPRT